MKTNYNEEKMAIITSILEQNKNEFTSVRKWDEFAKINKLPSSSTIIRAFGSWNKAKTEIKGEQNKITEEDFTGKFVDISAPVKIADLEIASPVTGSIGVSGGSNSNKKVDSTYNPERWNQSDESPEANAMRKLYGSGLLLSEDNQEGLKTPKADISEQEQAIINMEEAGLLDKYIESTGIDSTPENNAIEKLEEAGLLSYAEGESKEVALGATVEVTNIDAISGATVSSEAVGEAVNNAYFFLKESILK